MGEGRSFTSLGIREIAREAGMVPNAFYRHFRSTDDLGLGLVEEVGITLRRLLREARQADVALDDMVRRSVGVYHQYVLNNRLLFLFISSERSGGSRILRLAIRNDVSHFTNEMAQDFRRLGVYKDLSTAEPANDLRPDRDHHAGRRPRNTGPAARPAPAGGRDDRELCAATAGGVAGRCAVERKNPARKINRALG